MKTRSPDIQKRPVTDCPKGARIGVSLGLVPEKSEKSVLSLDTRFSSGIRPGPSLVVQNEDKRSKYSGTVDYGQFEAKSCLQQPVFPGGHPSKY